MRYKYKKVQQEKHAMLEWTPRNLEKQKYKGTCWGSEVKRGKERDGKGKGLSSHFLLCPRRDCQASPHPVPELAAPFPHGTVDLLAMLGVHLTGMGASRRRRFLLPPLPQPLFVHWCFPSGWNTTLHTRDKHAINVQQTNEGTVAAALEMDVKMYLQRWFCLVTVTPFLPGRPHFHLQATAWFFTYTSCYRPSVYVPPKLIYLYIMLNVMNSIQRVGPLEGALVIEQSPLERRLVSLEKRPDRAPSPLPPCEDTVRSRDLEQGPHPSMPAPWSQTFTLRTMRNKFLLFEITQSVICCYSGPNRPKYFSSEDTYTP